MSKVVILAVLALAGPAVAGWEPDIRLSVTTDPSTTPLSGRGIAASGDGVHVVWQEGIDPWDHEFPEIYYARSTNAGAAWEPQHRLTVDSAISESPCVAACAPYVHVAWHDSRGGAVSVFHKRSSDNGGTWSADEPVPEATGTNPVLCADEDFLHLVHIDWRNSRSDVFYRRSTDRGGNWEPERQLTDTSQSYSPVVAAAGDRVYVAWYDYRDGNAEVYFRRSDDRGGSWGPEVRLTNDSTVSLEPAIAASGPDVHVVWNDYRLGGGWIQRILHRRSTDGGETWSDQARLTPDTIESYYFSLAASGPDVHLAWMGHPTSNRESHIYHARSRDRGQTWGGHARLTESVSDYALRPSVAVLGPGVHVAWCERRDTVSYEEVYYRRDPDGNAAIAEPGAAGAGRPRPTFVRASARLGELGLPDRSAVHDAQGRRVALSAPLRPGCYFVRGAGRTAKLVCY
ncbi:MAG: sialidase family protein [bacterium]